ncbi:MAG TPA: hypothetical protein VM733_13410 [Thermoanaerobaculia bacterium]|nr:hypothetical protein [Thermoanaerobaculia bacterium]
MRRGVIVAGAAVIAAVVAIVLVLHGTDEAGMRAAIRATARTSAVCVALAFARVRIREFSALLPISHAAHYAVIAAAALWRGPFTVVFGLALLALMVWNALRPNTIAISILWIAFIIAFARPGVIHISVEALLLGAGVVRWRMWRRASARRHFDIATG